MQVEIKIDNSLTEPKVIIMTNCITDEINEIANKLSETHSNTIAGFKDDILEIIEPNDIIRIFTVNQKVVLKTQKGEYSVKLRLYELENRLSERTFVRISNSEIINLKKVINMDLSFKGTICVKLFSGETSYVSRRYVAKIKQMLGI